MIEKIEFDCAGNTVDAIVMAKGEKFATYRFKEEDASYSEKIIRGKGPVMVEHQVSFTVDGINELSRSSMNELISESSLGLVAIITTWEGVGLLIGVSEKFGNEKPLRIRSVHAYTGRELSDTAGQKIILSSVDASEAAVIKGDIQGIL